MQFMVQTPKLQNFLTFFANSKKNYDNLLAL